MRDSGSVIQVHGHNLPVDDVVCEVAVRNIDARVLAGRLGQSLLEALLKRPRHLPSQFLDLPLQFRNPGISWMSIASPEIPSPRGAC